MRKSNLGDVISAIYCYELTTGIVRIKCVYMEHSSVNISMPKRMRQYVRSRINRGGFGNVSEYFRDLIRREEEAITQGEIEARLLQSLNEDQERPMRRATWTKLPNSIQKGRKPRR